MSATFTLNAPCKLDCPLLLLLVELSTPSVTVLPSVQEPLCHRGHWSEASLHGARQIAGPAGCQLWQREHVPAISSLAGSQCRRPWSRAGAVQQPLILQVLAGSQPADSLSKCVQCCCMAPLVQLAPYRTGCTSMAMQPRCSFCCQAVLAKPRHAALQQPGPCAPAMAASMCPAACRTPSKQSTTCRCLSPLLPTVVGEHEYLAPAS